MVVAAAAARCGCAVAALPVLRVTPAAQRRQSPPACVCGGDLCTDRQGRLSSRSQHPADACVLLTDRPGGEQHTCCTCCARRSVWVGEWAAKVGGNVLAMCLSWWSCGRRELADGRRRGSAITTRRAFKPRDSHVDHPRAAHHSPLCATHHAVVPYSPQALFKSGVPVGCTSDDVCQPGFMSVLTPD